MGKFCKILNWKLKHNKSNNRSKVSNGMTENTFKLTIIHNLIVRLCIDYYMFRNKNRIKINYMA